MTKEEFNEKLSVLLKTMDNSGLNELPKLYIYGDTGDNGVYFVIKARGLYKFDVKFGFRTSTLFSTRDIYGDNLLGAFHIDVVSKVQKLYMYVSSEN